MAWFHEAIFYHIYPLGLTNAPKQNDYGEVKHRLKEIFPWITHIKELGCNAIYIGPLFESVGHGYETTDYKKLDSRLGDNKDLTEFVDTCHREGIRVILDGVFNHTGRDFFAFSDLKKNREGSLYKDWYCNVNFGGNTEYNDGFSYQNWGGYNLLVKLNQKNPGVQEYIADVIRFWVQEFHIDGIRLDAADVLDFDYMQILRRVANEVKEDFWLMGEVIHGDYGKWANEGTLHSVTNYQLHKALYSGHNDHNYFEIAHTVKYLNGLQEKGIMLYNFVDNHDVERIYTKLQNKNHFLPVHILLYTLPGIPSIYYGSEFGMEGKKERGSDDSLRPSFTLDHMKEREFFRKIIAMLGKIRSGVKALTYGNYEELLLTNRQYAFARRWEGKDAFIVVNNDENSTFISLPVGKNTIFLGLISGKTFQAENGRLNVELGACLGEIFIEETGYETFSVLEEKIEKRETIFTENKKEEEVISQTDEDKKDGEEERKEKIMAEEQPVKIEEAKKQEKNGDWAVIDRTKSYEEMSVEELQAVIYEKMAKNGPVTDRMKQDIVENIYHNSLVTWAKSF